MKRVVGSTNAEGRSYVVSVDELDLSTPQTAWEYEPSQIWKRIESIDPSEAADWVGPGAPGGVRWHVVAIEPAAEDQEQPAYPGFDEIGFHTTRTVDFDFIAEGELTLLLDEGSVRLQRGDLVILQAARHAWRNEGRVTAILYALLHRPAPVRRV
jgi:quercetin dioxygenase-like cupin family protein